MAAGEDGEHTRFPCLAMVRYAVASVVTVLAAAVVVVAIDLVLRPEDVRLSIDYGYIEADRLWSVTETNGADELPPLITSATNDNEDDHSPVVIPSYHEPGAGAGAGVGAAAGGRRLLWRTTPTLADDVEEKPGGTSTPADEVNLRVILSAHNPGGRSQIDCGNTIIRLLDMKNAYREIVQFELENFTVPQQTAHTQSKRVVINDPKVLAYIWSHYHGETSFSVTVQVDATITSHALGTKTYKRTYFCRQVTVGLISYGSQLTDVACKTGEETQLLVESLPLPAPAPAPMG